MKADLRLVFSKDECQHPIPGPLVEEETMTPETRQESATALARALWQALDPFHALVYFAPEGPPIYTDIGLRPGWMPYFASRSAALGAVPASLVTAAFYSFHPGLVARSLPAAWELASATDVGAARLQVADAAIRNRYPDAVTDDGMVEAATLARHATEGCELAGRPLYSAHAALDWPEEPHLQLWWAATLLREHRGDGHVACLLHADLPPCQALVLHDASGDVPAGYLRKARGWSEDEWTTATEHLRTRGWLDTTGAITDTGRTARHTIEDRTDELAAGPVNQLGEDGCRRLIAYMTHLQ